VGTEVYYDSLAHSFGATDHDMVPLKTYQMPHKYFIKAFRWLLTRAARLMHAHDHISGDEDEDVPYPEQVMGKLDEETGWEADD